MVGDITYIFTWEGWLYLATVIDCATRKLTGWAMDDNYKTPLISDAIKMAARNLDLPEGAIFHSDRGSNYTSAEFAGVLEGNTRDFRCLKHSGALWPWCPFVCR
jgi:putative transposase